MTLSEFKKIYAWEYGHRMYGRVIGLSFTLPFIYYTYKGYINRTMYKRLGLLFGIGFSQGLVGWWMVKSGLKEHGNETYNNLPKVSPYRLATHLGVAFFIYMGLLYNGMYSYSQRNTILHALNELNIKSPMPAPNMFKYMSMTMVGLSTITALAGAFVAGNEAGLVYNEWPKMGLGYIPSDIISPYINPKWRNIFENSSTVQFIHRNSAYLTVLLSYGILLYSKRIPNLSNHVRIASYTLATATTLQAGLGIYTLLNYCPIKLASLHQSGSMIILSVAIWLMFVSRSRGYGSAQTLLNQISKQGKPNFLIL